MILIFWNFSKVHCLLCEIYKFLLKRNSFSFWTSVFLVSFLQTNAHATQGQKIPQGCQRSLTATGERIPVSFWKFPGGEMDPADMVFYSDGLLAVKSRMYSENEQERYFTYRRDDDHGEVAISFCDPGLVKFMRTEAGKVGGDISKIDEKSNTVFYKIKNGSIDFQGWYFYKQKN